MHVLNRFPFSCYHFALDSRKREPDEALVDKNSQPFSVVEDEGFRGLVKKRDCTYVLPTRQV